MVCRILFFHSISVEVIIIFLRVLKLLAKMEYCLHMGKSVHAFGEFLGRWHIIFFPEQMKDMRGVDGSVIDPCLCLLGKLRWLVGTFRVKVSWALACHYLHPWCWETCYWQSVAASPCIPKYLKLQVMCLVAVDDLTTKYKLIYLFLHQFLTKYY